jgi:hypothetical protein
MNNLLRTGFAAAALVGAAWTTVTVAAEAPAVPAPSVAPGPAAAPAPAAGVSAQRAFRDPTTGQLRAPTAEELQQILDEERALRAATGAREPSGPTALAIRRWPSGMRSAVLGPDSLVSLKAQRGPDGKIVITHDRTENEHPAAPTQAPTE